MKKKKKVERIRVFVNFQGLVLVEFNNVKDFITQRKEKNGKWKTVFYWMPRYSEILEIVEELFNLPDGNNLASNLKDLIERKEEEWKKERKEILESLKRIVGGSWSNGEFFQ